MLNSFSSNLNYQTRGEIRLNLIKVFTNIFLSLKNKNKKELVCQKLWKDQFFKELILESIDSESTLDLLKSMPWVDQ